MKILLDTHAWIWSVQSTGDLSPKAARIINSPEISEILVSAISIWELCKLYQKKRITLPVSLEDWIARALDHPKIRVVDLGIKVSIESIQLPGEFHGDPADQILVATARRENATLITKDKKIRGYRFVESAW